MKIEKIQKHACWCHEDATYKIDVDYKDVFICRICAEEMLTELVKAIGIMDYLNNTEEKLIDTLESLQLPQETIQVTMGKLKAYGEIIERLGGHSAYN